MIGELTRHPPATHALRPERADRPMRFLDRLARRAAGRFVGLGSRVRSARMAGFVARVDRHTESFSGLSDERIAEEVALVRLRLHREGLKDEPVARAFALIREISGRLLGMRHFSTQLVGGRVLLSGMVAEMETGEGKTLTANLAAGTAGLAGIPVHVITVNDYLTSRDADWMRPVYEALGLRVGCVVHGVPPQDRRAAYACDVTYCTNKEIAFDYLRDWLAMEGRPGALRLQAEALYGRASRVQNLLLRGLHYAIVDEADSVLIDEARTPLIISGGGEQEDEREFLEQALVLAGDLERGKDFEIRELTREVTFTEAGKARLRDAAATLGPVWSGVVRREEMVRMALSALHLFHRDEEYVVQEDKVQIVDEFTGRIMADRSYERGLHQLIETKEGVELTQRPETRARISYQRFFRRYLNLSGMTGTAREVRGELWNVYALPVMRIPTHKPRRRKAFPDRIFRTEAEKWRAVAERIQALHDADRPVLVGTRSVAASERAAALLAERDIPHQVLNAKQDREEAEIIARAGEAGCVTIATSMAGRGTDILLGDGVKDRSGLHVILTERHEAARVDRQLAGRCGRLGDPGSYEAILSLEDPIVQGGRGDFLAWIAARLAQAHSPLWVQVAGRAIRLAQRRVERYHARMRKNLLKEDERRGNFLSFSGGQE